MTQICCRTTHRQIRSGNCPWCHLLLPVNQADRRLTSYILDATWWDVSRMLVDLGDELGKEERLTTAANLADHLEVESLEEALPVLATNPRNEVDFYCDTPPNVLEVATWKVEDFRSQGWTWIAIAAERRAD